MQPTRSRIEFLFTEQLCYVSVRLSLKGALIFIILIAYFR